MQKILVICGPTATGKTSLALILAKKFNGEIVSADSRQVYKGMDIGTGKDLPSHSKFEIRNSKLGGFYIVKNIPLWGYDLVDSKKEFSVSQYVKIARRIIEDIKKRNKLPILVGGTGLYIRALIDGIDSVDVPKNDLLRKKLEGKPSEEIFEILKEADSLRASLLNNSDKKNKRRLIRALEIAEFKKLGKKIKVKPCLKNNNDVFFVGLTGNVEILNKNIKARVFQRIENDFLEEIKNLIKDGFLQSPQAVNTLGYKQWLENRSNKGTLEEFVNTWEIAERKYVKRQLTWFKKDTRLQWFDIGNLGFEKMIEKMIQKWYDGGNEASSSKSRTFV